MRIWPAIDIRSGKCVRLQQGDYERETTFHDDPLAVANRWVELGASGLHVVDLDGARSGTPNLDLIESFVKSTPVEIQMGGGLRDTPTLERAFDAGLARAIIGTRAVDEPAWVVQVAQRWPNRILVSLDLRNGEPCTEGWYRTGSVTLQQLGEAWQNVPLAGIVVTDVHRDGMMGGPNVELMLTIRETFRFPLVASGGVATLEDIHQLANIGIEHCIIGRALYEGRINLPDALRASQTAEVQRGANSVKL